MPGSTPDAARQTREQCAQSPIQVTPVRWESTRSYIARLAQRHHLSDRDFLSGLGIALPVVSDRTAAFMKRDRPYDTWELYFSASAQRIIADFCGLPPTYLQQSLLEWAQRPAEVAAKTPSARLMLSGRPSVSGCPKCAAARTGALHPVRQYLPCTSLVCRRHKIHMLSPHTLRGSPLAGHANLDRAPEVLDAHRDHLRLARHWGVNAHRVVHLAMKLTEAWRRAEFPEERIWPARALRIGHGRRAKMWLVLAREAVTYPESIALARVLLDHTFHDARRRPRAGTGPPNIHERVADRLQRPWLVEPNLYPPDFEDQVRQNPPLHEGACTSPLGWTYRWSPTDRPVIELLELGYRLPGTTIRARSYPSPLPYWWNRPREPWPPGWA